MARTRKTRPEPGVREVATKAGPRWRAVVDVAQPGERRKQQTRTFDDIDAANEWVRGARKEVENGTYKPPSVTTFRQLADQWLASRRDIREVSRNGYDQVLKCVHARIGDRPTRDLTREDLDQLVEWLKTSGGLRGKGLSQRSVVYTLGAVRQVLEHGVQTGALPSNVAAHVKAPRRRKGDRAAVTVWEPAELIAFRTVADADPWAAAWRLTLCGLRRSEVLGLRWESVDTAAGTVTVESSRVALRKGKTAIDDPKSEASHRTISVDAMHPGTTDALIELSKSSAYNADGLVLVDALGRGIAPDAYSERFRDLCRQAEVPVIRLCTPYATASRACSTVAGSHRLMRPRCSVTPSRRTFRCTSPSPSVAQRPQRRYSVNRWQRSGKPHCPRITATALSPAA